MKRRARRICLPVAMVAGAAALTLTPTLQAAPAAQADEVAHAAGFTANLTWSQTLPDANSPIALSSPNVANLDGQPAVVVGDHAGKVYAYHLSNGTGVAGWPYNAGAPIASSPSVAPISPNGTDSVFIGSGDAGDPTGGGYQAITNTGGDQWFAPGDEPRHRPDAAFGHRRLADGRLLRRRLRRRGGSLGQNTDALGAGNGAMLAGFPWFQGDSVFSTAAVADLYADGNNELISGGDSSAGVAYGQTYGNGGHIRILVERGQCGDDQSDQAGSSASTTRTRTSTAPRRPSASSSAAGPSASPSGTGATTRGRRTRTRSSPSTRAAAWPGAISSTGSPLTRPPWRTCRATGSSTSSKGPRPGTIYVLNGSNGAVIWSASTTGQVIGSPVTADLTGGGYQDVIVPTTNGIDIFDGRSGAEVATLGTNYGFQSSPLVTDDPDGHIGITGAGYYGGATDTGYIGHWEIDNTSGVGVERQRDRGVAAVPPRPPADRRRRHARAHR